MLGTRQLRILDALAEGNWSFGALARRIGGSRRELLLSVARLEAVGMVRVARTGKRMGSPDLVMLAPQPVRRAHDGQVVAAAG